MKSIIFYYSRMPPPIIWLLHVHIHTHIKICEFQREKATHIGIVLYLRINCHIVNCCSTHSRQVQIMVHNHVPSCMYVTTAFENDIRTSTSSIGMVTPLNSNVMHEYNYLEWSCHADTWSVTTLHRKQIFCMRTHSCTHVNLNAK